MEHRINVSKLSERSGRYGHYFAAHVTHAIRPDDVIRDICNSFPESQGFKISVTYWEHTGRTVDIEDILETIRP